MKNSKAVSVFTNILAFTLVCGIYAFRFLSLPSVIPQSWTPESLVVFTARVLHTPEHTDTYTLIHQGIWTISLDGYAAIKPGTIYSFSGRIQRKVLFGRTVRIIMMDPTFAAVDTEAQYPPRVGEALIILLDSSRQKIISLFHKQMPEPHGSLAAGILLGVTSQISRDFYESLVSTGTVHIIAASGYNTAIVAGVIMAALRRISGRGRAAAGTIIILIIYILFTGASASVVRAGLMTIFSSAAYIWGRPPDSRRLLWIVGIIMVIVQPYVLFDVGFQLSVAATAGILYLEPLFRQKSARILSHHSLLQAILSDYLFPTLAATIPTLPIILWYFGRISYISPIVNVFVLPAIPLIMFLAFAALTASWIPGLSWFLFSLVYVPVSYVVAVIRFFG